MYNENLIKLKSLIKKDSQRDKYKIKMDGGNQLKNAGDITKEMLIFATHVMNTIKSK